MDWRIARLAQLNWVEKQILWKGAQAAWLNNFRSPSRNSRVCIRTSGAHSHIWANGVMRRVHLMNARADWSNLLSRLALVSRVPRTPRFATPEKPASVRKRSTTPSFLLLARLASPLRLAPSRGFRTNPGSRGATRQRARDSFGACAGRSAACAIKKDGV